MSLHALIHVSTIRIVTDGAQQNHIYHLIIWERISSVFIEEKIQFQNAA